MFFFNLEFYQIKDDKLERDENHAKGEYVENDTQHEPKTTSKVRILN